MAKPKNFKGWSIGWSSEFGEVVYDRVGNYASPEDAAAFRKWKAEQKTTKVGGHAKDKARREAAQAKRAEIKNGNRFKYSVKLSKSTNRGAKVPQKYAKFFDKSTRLSNRGGHLEKWARPLTLRGGKNPNFNYRRVGYTKFKSGSSFRNASFSSSIKKTSATQLWGNKIGKGSAGGILNGPKEWIRQLEIAHHQLWLSAESFRVLVGERAIKVFRNSFKYSKFYSNNSTRWSALAEYTRKKRSFRGTGSRILVEYSDLQDSFELEKNAAPMTTRVSTAIVPANESHHKRNSLCYAGFHNEGKGTYGRLSNGKPGRPYIKRKFMGHSSFLNPITDSFLRRMMKVYLFDNVWMIKKA